MPLRIPQYNEPQVSPTAPPTVRRAENVPLEAFGGGQAGAAPLGQVRGLAGDLAQIQEAMRTDEDKVRTLEEYRRINEWEVSAMESAKSKRGKDALGITDQTLKSFDEYAQERARELTSPRQKQMFSEMTAQRRLTYRKQLGAYENEQREFYHQAEYKATAESIKDRAFRNPESFLDPKHAAGSLEMLRGIAMDRAKGLGPEAQKAVIAGAESDFHASVIQGLNAQGRDILAKDYLSNVKDKLDPDTLVKLTPGVEESSLRGESQRLADLIMQGQPETLQAAMDEAKKRAGDNPDLRSALERRVGDLWGIRKSTEVQVYNETFTNAVGLIEQGKDTDSIPPDQWRSLKLTDQNKLRGLVKAMKQPTMTENGWELMTQFSAKTDAEVAQMDPARLMAEYRPQLDKENYNRVLSRYQDTRQAKAGTPGSSMYTDDQNIFKTMKASKLGGLGEEDELGQIDGDKSKAFVEFKDEVERRQLAFAKATGKPTPDPEKKRIMQEIALERTRKVTVEDWSLSPGLAVVRAMGGSYSPLRTEMPLSELMKPENLRRAVVEMPWEFRQSLYNLAPTEERQGLKFQEWENKYRARVNLAWLAQQRGAGDAEIRDILAGR